jgi:hypothetical protein
MPTDHTAALELLMQATSVIGRSTPDVDAFWQDFAGLVDLDGILDNLTADDARVWAGIVFYLCMTHDEPEAALRKRAA